MKQLIAIALILGFAVSGMFAQSINEINKEMKQIVVQMDGDMMDMPGMTKMVMKLDKELGAGNDAADAPYMGVFVEDLSFPKAQELGYKGYVGVLITGVVPDSPAWNFRLQEDDIIVGIDGKEITNQAVFDKLRKLYRANDTVALDLSRGNEIIKIDFTFGARPSKDKATEGEKPGKKKKLSPGYGGGSWLPLWSTTDLEDVNYLLASMGFRKLNEDGILMQGGGGKGPLGKGFFIGGVGYGYSNSDKVPDATDQTYHIWMNYSNVFGGVTLDKRIPITKNFVSSIGFMLGGGEHSLEIMKNNSNYDWTNWGGTFLNSENTHTEITRAYLMVQPKAELMYRLLSWLEIRGEVGYVYGYAPSDGWKVKGTNNDTIDIQNSPNTEYQGLTFSVGPWFGF